MMWNGGPNARLLTGQRRSTSAVARVASEVFVIPRDDFLAATEAEPKLMRRLLETTARRLAEES